MVRALSSLASKVNIEDPDEVSILIAQGKWRDSYKANLCDFYSHYCKNYGLQYVKGRYRRDHKIPRVPSEEKIDLIIAHASKKYAIIYSIIKECGLRPIEVGNLTPNDIDLEKGLISVYTAKNGEPRILKLKENTLAMITEYVRSRNFNLSDRIFPPSTVISNTYERLKASLANKLKTPEIKKIRLYDLRHFYATMLYHRTKDILLVKERLGHRNINNTLIYTHLISFDEKEEYYSATAKTIDEAKKLRARARAR